MLDQLRDEIAAALSKATGMSQDEVLATMETGKVGDLSSKIAFVLAMERNQGFRDSQEASLPAKEKKENPAKLAADICQKLKLPESFEKFEAAGPYINFYLSDKAYASILKDILSRKDRFGSGKKKKGKTVIEFPSVNPNKPWHIGHLRNAILGDSVARILEFDGENVERMDYIDDLGLQVAQSLWGFLNYDQNPEGKFDAWLGHQYVGIAKKLESDKAVLEGVRETLAAMEEGGNDISAAGRDLAEKCVMAQYQTAFDLGIYHDVLVFESDILRTIFDEGLELIKENDAVVLETEGKNAGCLVVKLGGEFEKEFGKMENPDKVLLRSDGTAVYTGKDVIFHLWKFGKLKKNFLYEPFIKQPNKKVAYKSSPSGTPMDFGRATRVINVIGVEQKYPQRVIVEVLRRLAFKDAAASLNHLSYERVGLPEGDFSGRKGTWLGYTADDLLEEAKKRVLEKIKLDVDGNEKSSIAKTVGVGAIKFSFLRTGSEKRIVFKWDEALSMEGNSGPYAQYAYVRTKGILGKAKEKPEVAVASFAAQEKALIRRLAQLHDTVTRSSRELAPHHMAQYAIDVAADFTAFYGACPVLTTDDQKTRQTRLAITLATAIVLSNSLSLLGIECPERM